ncbi:hypothetical protein JCM10914_5948 [Paenibacillus sp. JCM 10914]|nr:hypothetical protein JCM10914_5948 [Paenibacillus sp. JCM 10914]
MKCEGCNKEAKYIVYDQPHCTTCMLDAVECRGYVEVRWLEDDDTNKIQREFSGSDGHE